MIYGIRTGLHAYHIIRWGTIMGQIRVFYTILIKSFGVVKKSQSKNAKKMMNSLIYDQPIDKSPLPALFGADSELSLCIYYCIHILFNVFQSLLMPSACRKTKSTRRFRFRKRGERIVLSTAFITQYNAAQVLLNCTFGFWLYL